MLRTLLRNPIECWAKVHFEQPIVLGGFPFARVAVVSDPAVIRKLLVEEPAAFRKSALERRILSPRLREGRVAVDGEQGKLECKAEMGALALDALMRSIFHGGLGQDHDTMCAAARTYFAVAGRIDPFDIIGLPDFLPRMTHWRPRSLLRPFDQSLDAAIARRRRVLNEHSDPPRDILGILLTAQAPLTGRGLTDAEVKANRNSSGRADNCIFLPIRGKR